MSVMEHRATFELAPEAASEARAVVNAELGPAVSTKVLEDATLLVSELVTNACLHGGDPVTLRLELSRTRARVEVEDGVPGWPGMRSPTDRDPGGRGLLIVDSLSHVWGIDQAASGGKVVWAEVLINETGHERVGCI